MKGMARLYLGTCGWSLRQEEYFRRFGAIEVQQTFYEPPRPETLRRWRKAAPPGFAFAIKAWQLITHPATSPTYRRLRTPLDPARREQCGAFRRTDVVEMAFQRTMEAAEALDARVVLFQTPASFGPEPRLVEQLREFFRAHPPGARRFVWEPRGAWPGELVRAICEELHLIHGVDPFVSRPTTTGTAYFRLHGIGGYRHRFSDEELDRLADLVRHHLARGEEVWCLFNNVTMADDASRMGRRLSTQAPPGG